MREMTSEVLAQLVSGDVEPFILLEVGYDDGNSPPGTAFMRLTSTPFDVAWDGETWTGLPVGVLSFSAPEETVAIAATGAEVTLNGADSTVVSLALQSLQRGKPFRMWFGFLSERQIIVDPYLMFDGNTDVPTIRFGRESATIKLTAENVLMELQRTNLRRYTREDLRSEYPDDTFFDWVEQVQRFTGQWGGGVAAGSTIATRTPPYVEPPSDNTD